MKHLSHCGGSHPGGRGGHHHHRWSSTSSGRCSFASPKAVLAWIARQYQPERQRHVDRGHTTMQPFAGRGGGGGAGLGVVARDGYSVGRSAPPPTESPPPDDKMTMTKFGRPIFTTFDPKKKIF